MRIQAVWRDSLPVFTYTQISDTIFYKQIIVDSTQLAVDTSHFYKLDSHAILFSRRYTTKLLLATEHSNSALTNSHWQELIGYHRSLKMYAISDWYITGDALGIGSLAMYDMRTGNIYPLPSSYDGACNVPVLSPNKKYMFTYDYCPDCPDEESVVNIYQVKRHAKNKIVLIGSTTLPGSEDSQLTDAAEINAIYWGRDGNIYIRARKFTVLEAENERAFAGYICCAFYRIDLKQNSKPTK